MIREIRRPLWGREGVAESVRLHPAYSPVGESDCTAASCSLISSAASEVRASSSVQLIPPYKHSPPHARTMVVYSFYIFDRHSKPNHIQ
jgi:hypothetical protein